MIYLGFNGLHLALDLMGLGLLLAAVACLAAVVWLIVKRRSHASPAVALFVVLTLVLLYRGTMAPARSWPIMLASIEATTGADRLERVEDFKQHWQHREMRLVDWYFVARRWGVCHQLWSESACSKPTSPFEAEGVAREILDEL